MKLYKTTTLCTSLVVIAAWLQPAHAAIIETGDVVDTATAKIVGDTGVGTLTINDNTANALAVELGLRFGEQAGSEGTGLITGIGSSLSISNNVEVGGTGTGHLTVSAGGQLNADSATLFHIGRDSGGIGEVLVTGTGSSLTSDGLRFHVGFEGTGTLNIEDNATVQPLSQTYNDEAVLFLGSVATGNGTVNVRTGATLDTTTTDPSYSSIYILNGSGELNVESGGHVIAERVRIVLNNPGKVGLINITGNGSSLTASDYIQVEAPASSTATFNVSDFATGTIARRLYVGDSANSVGVANVTDHGSLTADLNIRIGRAGTGTMNINSGGTAEALEHVYIAWEFGTGTINVTDAGSTLTAGNRLRVGWGSPGEPANATLNVGRGAVVNALGNSAGSGLGLAIAPDDIANLIFTIGDDGTSTIDSGHINASEFFFGSGSSLFDLVVDSGAILTLGDKFTLIDYMDWDGNLFDNIADDTLFASGGYNFLINYNDDLGGGNFALTATLASIPEPTSLVLLGLGGLTLLMRRRNSRASATSVWFQQEL